MELHINSCLLLPKTLNINRPAEAMLDTVSVTPSTSALRCDEKGGRKSIGWVTVMCTVLPSAFLKMPQMLTFNAVILNGMIDNTAIIKTKHMRFALKTLITGERITVLMLIPLYIYGQAHLY